MQVSIDTGRLPIEIIRDGEVVGTVSVSLGDAALLSRLRTVAKKARELEAKSRLEEGMDVDEALDEAERMDRDIRKLVDWGFGAPVSGVAFGENFSFTTSGGVTAVEQFLNGVIPGIEKAFKAETEAAKKRQNKYLEKYQK